MNESRYHVLLLGAGFSRPWGLPVMREFMSTARRRFYSQEMTDRSLKGFYEKMLSFCQRCQRSSQQFNMNWENIEDLYTQADMLRLANNGNDDDQICQSISWAIWDVYRQLRMLSTGEQFNDDRRFSLPNLKDAFNLIKRDQKLHPVVVTTNYDLIAELGATKPQNGEQMNQRWEFFYPGWEIPDCSDGIQLTHNPEVGITRIEKTRSKANAFPLIKLHGSVNWMRETNHDSDKWKASLEIGNTKGAKSGINDASFDVESVCNKQSPAIIPPMLGKTSDSPVISAQWKAAIEAFSFARKITIVGYSFPSTDSFMPRLLAEGIGRNDDFEEIVIVDTGSKDYWTQVIRRLFTTIAREHKVKFLSKNSSLLFDGGDKFFGKSRNDAFEGEMIRD